MREVTANLLRASISLIVFGLLLASRELILVSLIPLIFLAIPYSIRIRSVVFRHPHAEFVGEVFEIEINIDCVGFGILKAMHRLPNVFEVVEGSNAVSSFVIGKKNVVIRYRARSLRRGVFSLNEIYVEKEHPFFVTKSHEKFELDIRIEIRQKLRRIVRVETARTVAKSPLPDIDISRIGVPGTDFREIKEYVHGEPIKFINWKATARFNRLMVNKYEVEGKKTIWFFLDANRYMTYGESIRNCLEYGIELLSAMAYYFISRGHKVGMYVIGNGSCVYPDVGKRQFRRICDELLKVESGDEDVCEALEKTKKFLMIYKPFVFLITRIEYSRPVKFVSDLIKMNISYHVLNLRDEHAEVDGFARTLIELIRSKIKRSIINLTEINIGTPPYKIVAGVIGG